MFMHGLLSCHELIRTKIKHVVSPASSPWMCVLHLMQSSRFLLHAGSRHFWPRQLFRVGPCCSCKFWKHCSAWCVCVWVVSAFIARLSPIVRKSRVGQRQGLVHQHVPFNFCAPTILAEDALCRFWSLLGHLVALTMLEAKSVFCIRRLCFSVLILAMLSWHQPTQRYTRQSNAFVRLTAEATSAILPNTSVFPAQATAAEAILLRCVLLLVSYLGGSMSIFSIYTKKRQTQICLWDTLGLAAVMWCSGHLNQACGGTENRSVLPCGQDPSEPPEKLAAEAILFYAACCWWRPSLHNICTYICIYIYI